MNKAFVVACLLTCMTHPAGVNAQSPDASKADSSNAASPDTNQFNAIPPQPLVPGKPGILLPRPSLPPMRISEQQKKLQFSVAPKQHYLPAPGEQSNFDALNMPTSRADYELPGNFLPPLMPITPQLPSPEETFTPLPFSEYSIPTRPELDVLEVLWAKENVMDTTIYSTLDPSAKMTMEDVQRLLEAMTQKGFLSRQLVSPRFEFNAFGVMIEMSMENRRNRVYEYRSKVDETSMKQFIDANAFLYQDDKTIVNLERLRAARNDSTLLNDLNTRIKTPHDETLGENK